MLPTRLMHIMHASLITGEVPVSSYAVSAERTYIASQNLRAALSGPFTSVAGITLPPFATLYYQTD